MENLGNIEEIVEEVRHFYPDKIHGAIGYLETRYNLNIYHASHIASIAWQTLNYQNPWNLPVFAVYLTNININ